MPPLDDRPIAFGPGGLIRNDPHNQGLLDQLQQTPVLLPEQLLKLAQFYKAYPTNVPLGNHLALLASTPPDKQKDVFPEYFGWADFFEDLADGAASNMAHEAGEGESLQLSVRQVPFSKGELLIETLDFKKEDSPAMRWHFVIGISPASDGL